jgi:hypothetical protein
MPQQRRTFVNPFWRRFAKAWLGTIVCSLAICTFAFGLAGFLYQYAASEEFQNESTTGNKTEQTDGRDWSIPIFKTMQIFLLNSGAEDDSGHPSNWFLLIARLSASALFLVLSSTVILKVIEDVRRLPRQLKQSNHVIICGLGQIGLQLLEDLHRQKKSENVIVIENNAANTWLDYARSLGASVLIGDATKASTLIQARAPFALQVFVVTGDDGVNLEVTAELGMLLSKESSRENPLELYVHIVDTSLATTLRPYCSILHDAPQMRVHVFNVHRTAAAQLVIHQLWPHAPKKPDEVAHYVLLGFGTMGQALAVQLAQLGHFPNCKRSRFTIADREIQGLASGFLSRFSRFTSWTEKCPGVTSFATENDAWSWNSGPLPDGLRVPNTNAIQYVCNAEFLKLRAGRSDEMFAGKLAEAFQAAGVKPVIFICGENDRENFDAAVQLREQLCNYGRDNVPIFVWLPRQPALADALVRDGRFYPFGECRLAASYKEITNPIRETIGEKLHDDYETQAVTRGEKQSKVEWSKAPDEFCESNRVAADHMMIKLATLGLRLHDDERPRSEPLEFDAIFRSQLQLLGEMEHYRWVSERLLAGWRFAPQGNSKEETAANKARKLNHNIVPWENLGPDRKKDFDQVQAILRECQKDRFSIEKIPSVES